MARGHVYVVDSSNHCVRYFRDGYYAVAPSSFGKVKRVFK